ncbi:MAG: transporter substrate-binding domain-containing protein [Rufibacter sp.]
MRIQVLVFQVFMLAVLAGCGQFPKDPNDTLAHVSGGTLKVGYSENLPWVVKGAQEPTGIEADLVKGFAQSINATVQWVPDTENELFQRLAKEELHLVIAGTTDDTPWKKKIAFTRPFAEVGKKKHVINVIKGENAFVVALEKYLHQQQSNLETRLRHESH